MNKVIVIIGVLLVASFAAYQFSRGGDAVDPPGKTVVPAVEMERAAPGAAVLMEEVEAAGTIRGTVAGIGEGDVAHVSVAKGPLTLPDSLSSEWLRKTGERVVFKTKVRDDKHFQFEDVPVGNYTVLVAIVNSAKRTPPAEWRIASEGAKVAEDETVDVVLNPR